MKHNVFIFTTALILSACSPAVNSEPATSQHPPTTQASYISQSHAEILDIIEAGNKAKKDMDAEALTNAAQFLTRLGAQPFNTDMQDLAQDWINTANELQGDKKNPVYRGRVRGPAYREKTLAPGAKEVLQEIYYASERAEITLKILGDGNQLPTANLALQVAEQTDTSQEDVCTLNTQKNKTQTASSCQWLPLWTAKYNITIVNHGDSPVSYLLVTN